MTFHDRLEAHKGGLVSLKADFFLYDGTGGAWVEGSGLLGRNCLLLGHVADGLSHHYDGISTKVIHSEDDNPAAEANLLVILDAAAQWLWVHEEEVELIDDAR